MSITRSLMLAALFAALPAVAQDKPAERKLYCWDEGGRKVCGDALPASAVNNARTEFSARTGMPSARVGRALSTAEQAELQAQEVQRKLEAERALAQKRSDTALAESYSNEEALRHSFQIRYELVDESLKTSQIAIKNQHAALLQLMRNAANLELEGKPIPPQLVQNIQTQRTALLDAQQLQQQQHIERQLLDIQQEEALARWRKARSQESTNH